MTREIWCLGPPGTGKTTSLSRMIEDAVRRHGSDGVLVSSFTKAAAVELAGRSLPIDSSRVGTLHSLCYRALGFPEIAESKIKEFNAEYPQHALVAASVPDDDPGWEYEARTQNDAYLAAYMAQRTRMIPLTQMTMNGTYDQGLIDFADAWREWKRENDYLDFCDLLERALYEFDKAPFDAAELFVDEAQDCGPLHMAVARKWAAGMEKLTLAFDDEQALYTFIGADPEQIFRNEPSEPPTVLSQSYRVPREVHALADRLRKTLTWRVEKEYLPRDADGFVKKRFDIKHSDPSELIALAEQGKRLMILASCSYMLKDTMAAFKAAGVPYANPYKPRRVDWNPLDPGTAHRWTPVRRVQAYLRPQSQDGRLWDAEDFRAWALHIKANDLFKRGVKTMIAQKEWRLPAPHVERKAAIDALLADGAAERFAPAYAQDVSWLAERLNGETGQRMAYPLRVAQKFGRRALLTRPNCIVGTVHSVKGAQADVVAVFPDLSAQGYEEWQAGGARKDSVIRMMYVAATRAREGLILCGPAGQRYVPIWQPVAKLEGT